MRQFDFNHIWKDKLNTPAICTDHETINYRQLRNAVLNRMSFLQDQGYHKLKRAALIGSANIPYIIDLVALWHLDVVTILLSPRYSAHQLDNILTQVGTDILFVGESGHDINTPDRVIKSRIGQIDLTPTDSDLPVIPLQNGMTILMTSGSSSSPKAVLHSLANHYFNAKGAAENIEMVAEDRWLLSLPLYHIGGLAIVFRSLFQSATLVIPQDQRQLAQAIDLHRVTHISLVPTQLKRLLSARTDLSNLKAILIGGAAIPKKLVDSARDKGYAVYTSYGSTELASQVATSLKDGNLSSLKVLAHREVKISEQGEVLLKGATLAVGYIKNNRVISLTDPEGWFHSGDMGSLDEQGHLQITGRKGSLFISGGENIYPEEIEKILLEYPSVEETLVVAVPDDEFGERPVAFLKAQGSTELDLKDLRTFLQSRIESFKIPDHFLQWPDDETPLKNQRQRFKQIAQDKLGF